MLVQKAVSVFLNCQTIGFCLRKHYFVKMVLIQCHQILTVSKSAELTKNAVPSVIRKFP